MEDVVLITLKAIVLGPTKGQTSLKVMCPFYANSVLKIMGVFAKNTCILLCLMVDEAKRDFIFELSAFCLVFDELVAFIANLTFFIFLIREFETFGDLLVPGRGERSKKANFSIA